MVRAVTADHILFDECIDAFRREPKSHTPLTRKEPSKSFVLTAFLLDQDWDLGICVVRASKEVRLGGAYSAYISTVDNPEWIERHNCHLFGIALSAIISFVTHKPCKSTRDDYLCLKEQLGEDQIQRLAIFHPILIAGPGHTQPNLSSERQTSIRDELKSIIDLLHKVDYPKYVIAIQSIRLAHLSIINKRDDFGLAYLLIVSAIETIAQEAITVKEVKPVHPSEDSWKEKAKNDELFRELLKEYRAVTGQNSYLKKRFIKFILEYAPVDKWKEYVLHPMQELADYIKDISPSHPVETLVQDHWSEKYPEEIEQTKISEVLGDSYKHRSRFVHSGEQPPHTNPNPLMNRFFQEYREQTANGIEIKILPNYQLLIGLSKYSLINWLNK